MARSRAIPGQKVHKFMDLAHFSPKQLEALQASKRFRFVFYGGSMGSGKSYFLRWAALYWLLKLHSKLNQRGVRVALFCEDFPALNDRHISRLKVEFPEWLGDYHEQSHEFRLKEPFGAGVLCFRNLDDPSKFMSSEFAAILVDELPKNPYSTFTMLRTRLRWPGLNEPKFVGAGNPGGEAWVKQYFVDRAFPPTEQEKGDFCYVRALPTDNPHLSPEYFKGLESLPEAERKAFLEGDWNAFEDVVDEHGFARLLSDSELANAVVGEVVHVGEKVLGVDPAGGGDKDAVVLCSETGAEVVFNQKLKDTMQLAVQVCFLADFHGVRHVAIDVTGIGQGLYDRLHEIRHEHSFTLHKVVFGERAKRPERYANLKAELYWTAREWVLKGGKMRRDEGWNEWTTIKWRKDTDRKVEIQSKSELRRHGIASPNVVDALCIAKAVAPKIKERKVVVNRLARAMSAMTGH